MAGVSTPWGVRLRYALNAPHKPRRRASLRRTPQGRQQIKRKGDTSNEVRKGTFLKRFDKIPFPFPFPFCQRKVEMSGFPPDRNVRFQGLLQGCSAGTWYLGLLWFLGFGVRSANPGGRRPEGLAERRAGSGQARRCR